jgi:hypothetical protein
MDAQRLQLRLQEAVNNMVADLQKTKIRSLQKNAFLAMAECYSDTRASQQQIDQCISVQEQLMQAVHQTIGNEMNSFQNRLQRCSMACQDDVKDKVSSVHNAYIPPFIIFTYTPSPFLIRKVRRSPGG